MPSLRQDEDQIAQRPHVCTTQQTSGTPTDWRPVKWRSRSNDIRYIPCPGRSTVFAKTQRHFVFIFLPRPILRHGGGAVASRSIMRLPGLLGAALRSLPRAPKANPSKSLSSDWPEEFHQCRFVSSELGTPYVEQQANLGICGNVVETFMRDLEGGDGIGLLRPTRRMLEICSGKTKPSEQPDDGRDARDGPYVALLDERVGEAQFAGCTKPLTGPALYARLTEPVCISRPNSIHENINRMLAEKPKRQFTTENGTRRAERLATSIRLILHPRARR
jgi:hypothetical protein